MKKIFLNAIGSIVLALAIGLLLSMPMLAYKGLSLDHKLRIEFGELPESDDLLRQWYYNHLNAECLHVSRNNNTVVVEYRNNNIFRRTLQPPWEAIGYKKTTLAVIDRRIHLSNTSYILSIMIIASQIGFLTVSLYKLRNVSVRNIINSDLRWLGESSIIGVGVLAGVIMALAGVVFGYVIQFLTDEPGASYNRWAMINEFETFGKFSVIFLGVIIAPICEELFFRGIIFRSFTDYGYTLTGYIVSSLSFAAVHFSPENIVVYVIFGTVLSCAYRKTQSLITAIVAHSINNAIAFTILLLWR